MLQKKDSSLNVTANRILKKYVDSGAGRDIFRQVGLDELYLAQKLMAIIDNPEAPYSARTTAIHIATKCLGLQRDVVENQTGAVIQINFAQEPAQPVKIEECKAKEVIDIRPLAIDR